jgi:hypothetical protein
MGGAYQQMLQDYETNKALKEIDRSEQWLAQHGYQSDLQDGMSASAAFIKWAPSLFKSSAGMADAMNLQQPPSAMDKANLAYRDAQTDKLKASLAPPAPAVDIPGMPPGWKSYNGKPINTAPRRVPPPTPPKPVMFPLDLGTAEKPDIKMFSAENAEALLNGNRMPDNAVNGATKAAIITRRSAGTNAPPGLTGLKQQTAGVKSGAAPNPVKPAGTKVQDKDGNIKWTKSEGTLPDGWTAVQ